MTTSEFINTIAPIIQKKAIEKGYKYPSAIIAQACLESAYGRSILASKYHNYFGMKCGSSWRGKSVNLSTMEEYRAGTLTSIKANFRVYDSMESGVNGYFDFISASRYANLKKATSSKNYLELIKNDGYATSSKYVENVYAVVTKYNLTQYDEVRENKPENDFVIPSLKGYKGLSIVDGLRKFGYRSSFDYRAEIWKALGNKDAYKGTAKQNIKLLNVLKKI